MPLDGLAALRTALTPLPVPWGVGPGLRAAVAAGSCSPGRCWSRT
jgi:hypothetical protein